MSLVSARELAREYDVSEKTIRNWAIEGRIPAIVVSPRCIRFDLEMVRKALEARQDKGDR